MIKKLLMLLITVGLSSSLAVAAFPEVLLYDDFDGAKLDESKWTKVAVEGNADEVTVEVENSEVHITNSRTGNRVGIMSVPTFNAEKERVTVAVKGISSTGQTEIAAYFNLDPLDIKNTVSAVVCDPGAGNNYFQKTVEGSWTKIFVIDRTDCPHTCIWSKEGDLWAYEIIYEDEEYKGEAEIPEMKKEDFKLFVYSYGESEVIIDSLCVYTGTEYPAAVEVGNKLSTVWGRIKAGR